MPAQCCMGALQCVTDPSSHVERCEATTACADGGACALGKDCCTAVCVGQCTSCVADYARCTAKSDCCNAASDCLTLDGGLVCTP